jgi:hypothetical protein
MWKTQVSNLPAYATLLSCKTVAYKPSDFAIINTDGRSDFDIEQKLTLQDSYGRKLDLKLNYM